MKKILYKVIKKIKVEVNKFFRRKINRRNRQRLKNKDVCLISSNCVGCLMLHDLGLRYNSPFVNMFIVADDYIKLLQNFTYYMQFDLKFIKKEGIPYPLAMLGDILLHCVHYKDENEVVEKWSSRKERIDLSNVFVIFTDRDGCTKEHLKAFDALPFKNKVVFTNKVHEDIKSSFCIKGFEKEESVGSLYNYKSWNGVKYYDDFDYVEWFNNGTK